MSEWVDNAWLSTGLGALAFVVLLVPGLVWQYRRHGAWSPSRMLGWAMVCLYFAALFVYTLLPLPEDGASWCAAHTVRANVRPFAFLEDIRRETAGLSLRAALRSAVVLQVVFNVVLFVPWGRSCVVPSGEEWSQGRSSGRGSRSSSSSPSTQASSEPIRAPTGWPMWTTSSPTPWGRSSVP